MRYVAEEQIKDLFTDPQEVMCSGLWFSGYRKEGEYKAWHENGNLYKHYFYKDGELDGECKMWHENGQLYKHYFYKDGELDGEIKQWFASGKFWSHTLYKKGKKIKVYLE